MPSKLRLMVKFFPEKQNGYEVYRGVEAIRFLEKHSGMTILNHSNVPQLTQAYALLRNNRIMIKGGVEIAIWRNRRGAKKTRYQYELDNGRRLAVWDAEQKGFKFKSVRLPGTKTKTFKEVMAEAGNIWRDAGRIQFAVQQPRRIADIVVDEAPGEREPRDR